MKLRHWTVPLLLALPAGSCSSLLDEDPESFITTDTYYNTPADIDAAAVAMYGLLLDWNFFRVQQHWTFELAADQGRFHPDEPNVETQAPEFLDWTATSRDAIQPWKMHYWMIQRANLVIEKAEGVEFTDAEQKAQLIAEGKFMRGFSYFWLARAYGGVPLLTSIAEQQASNEPRASEAEVIDQVIADATAAAADLPETRAATDAGRATKGAALMLLADAQRWRANVLGGGDAAWTAMRQAAQDVKDLGIYELEDNYLSAFLPRAEQRPEYIWAVIATGGSDPRSDLWGGIYYPRNLAAPAGWAVVSATLGFYNSYIPGDYRHEVTFWREGCNAFDPIDCDDPIEFTPVIDGEGYPHVYKYRPTDRGLNFWSGGDVNVPMYRYAETLLFMAEAENELGNLDEAVAHINMIRARARQGTGAESRTSPADYGAYAGETMDQAAIRETIYRERSWELSYELKRWFDLVQRGEAYFIQQLTTNDPLSDDHGNVDADHMRLPIPAEEIQKNPLIEQNPGYGG